MLAYVSTSRIELRLPAGTSNSSTVEIIVQIRDILYAVTEYNLGSIAILPDTAEIDSLLIALSQTDTTSLNTNPTVQLLASGSQNIVGQVVSVVSQTLNDIQTQQLQNAASSLYIVSIDC